MIILSFALLALLLLALAAALYRRWWDKGLTMALAFSAPEAVEGDELVLRETVENAKLLPVPMLAAKFRLSRSLVFKDEAQSAVSDHYYRNDIFAAGIYQRIVRSHPFTCARRGYYQVGDMSLSSGGLFHGETLVKAQTSKTALTVFPKPVRFDAIDILYRQVMGDVEVRRFTNPDPFAFRGIREYMPGDDFRAVNFKASAKSGELMVNVYSPTASREIVILLNLEPYAAVTRQTVLEGAIRIAASAAARFIAMGLAVGLVSNGRDSVTQSEAAVRAGGGADHLHALLVRLARMEYGDGPAPFAGRMPLPGDARAGAGEPYYLLVSPYMGEDLAAAYHGLYSAGGARWVIPVHPDSPKTATAEQRRAGITYMEVEL